VSIPSCKRLQWAHPRLKARPATTMIRIWNTGRVDVWHDSMWVISWQAKQLWEEEYGLGSFDPPRSGAEGREGSHRPINPTTATITSPTQPAAESKITYDLIAAAARQKVFLYQVSLPFSSRAKPSSISPGKGTPQLPPPKTVSWQRWNSSIASTENGFMATKGRRFEDGGRSKYCLHLPIHPSRSN